MKTKKKKKEKVRKINAHGQVNKMCVGHIQLHI